MLCVFNMRETPIIVPLPDGLAPRNVDAPVAASGPVGGSLSLAPFGVYIGAL